MLQNLFSILKRLNSLLKDNPIISIGAGAATVILVVLLSNAAINRCLNGEPQARSQRPQHSTAEMRVSSTIPTAPSAKTGTQRTLVPDDPQKYGILTYSSAGAPRTQTQWDLFMEKALIQSSALNQNSAHIT